MVLKKIYGGYQIDRWYMFQLGLPNKFVLSLVHIKENDNLCMVRDKWKTKINTLKPLLRNNLKHAEVPQKASYMKI